MDDRSIGMVREGGFEPPRLAAPPPQDGVSANSTTPAGSEASNKRLEEGEKTGGWPDPSGVNTRSSVIVRMELVPPAAVRFLLAKRPLEPERCSEDYSALFHPWEPE